MATDPWIARRAEYAAWLTTLGLDPSLVPLDTTWDINRPTGGPPTLTVQVFVTDANGNFVVRSDGGGRSYAREHRTVPMLTDSPPGFATRAIDDTPGT